jgi:hypothetical protein
MDELVDCCPTHLDELDVRARLSQMPDSFIEQLSKPPEYARS